MNNVCKNDREMDKVHNKKRIKLWVKALRSGKFKQGRNVLKTNAGRYCCLGVACEVFRKATGRGRWIKSFGDTAFSINRETANSDLPTAVANWFGIEYDPNLPMTDKNAGFPRRRFSRYVPATHLNDTQKWSFKKIAKAIEKEYLKKKKG